MESPKSKDDTVRKTNNTNYCLIGEKVWSDVDLQDIVITGIIERYTKEKNGYEGNSHSYTYELEGQSYYCWPWEITRYNEEGKLMPWGPGLDEYGNDMGDKNE